MAFCRYVLFGFVFIVAFILSGPAQIEGSSFWPFSGTDAGRDTSRKRAAQTGLQRRSSTENAGDSKAASQHFLAEKSTDKIVSLRSEVNLSSIPRAKHPRCMIHMRRTVGVETQLGTLRGKIPSTIHPCRRGDGRRLSAGKPDDNSHGGWKLEEKSCYHLDFKLAQRLARLANGSTLTELGAGKGCYAAYLLAHGVKVIAAIDGATDVDVITGGVVVHWDLTKPMEAKADWVMSLEVAEHIPQKYEAAFLDNIVRNARCYILLSWSQLADVGSGHINARSPEYVEKKMNNLGFSIANNISSYLQRHYVWVPARVFYRRTPECPEPN